MSATEQQWLVATPSYRLQIPKQGGTASLTDSNGQLWTNLQLVASVHKLGALDESVAEGGQLVGPELEDDQVSFEFWRPSSAWDQKVVRLRCTEDRVALSVRVHGKGRVTEVTLGGAKILHEDGASGLFRSSIDFQSLFVPTPTEPVSVVRPSSMAASLGIIGDATPGRLHGIFSPPPLVFGFGRGAPTLGAHVPDEGPPWLAAMVVAPLSESTFTRVLYRPLDGGWLMELKYEGQTAVKDVWVSPELVLEQVPNAYDTVTAYREQVAPDLDTVVANRPSWWIEPIFCGWGAQCAALTLDSEIAAAQMSNVEDAAMEARQRIADETTADRAAQGLIGPATVASAAHLSGQVNYDRWLRKLADHCVDPGTVVLDDRWQAEYGTCQPDLEHWPDLKGWIAGQHKVGRRVLLWFKAWDPGGLPAAECITDFTGRALAVDPTNPAYLARLEQIITDMLAPEGLDADGLKIDFTQRAPSGSSLRKHGESWGIAMLHDMLRTIHAAAKSAKPDALIINHTVNPQFGDTADMIRLNDILEEDLTGTAVGVVEQMRFRHAVASRALPDHLIDTDQWPIPNVEQWRDYVRVQPQLGVPALYYVDGIDGSAELLRPEDLRLVAQSWRNYSNRGGSPTWAA